MTVFFAQALRAKTELAPKALALSDQFGRLSQRFRGAEAHFDATGVGFGQRADFVQLHRRRHRCAKRDRVEAIFVTDEIGVGQRI